MLFVNTVSELYIVLHVTFSFLSAYQDLLIVISSGLLIDSILYIFNSYLHTYVLHILQFFCNFLIYQCII